MTDSKWFWAWKRAKDRNEQRDVEFSDKDYALISALLDTLYFDEYPKGDGKFSRARNYVESVRTECAWVKRNWCGNDELLLAFLSGIDVAFEVMELKLEIIKKGR